MSILGTEIYMKLPSEAQEKHGILATCLLFIVSPLRPYFFKAQGMIFPPCPSSLWATALEEHINAHTQETQCSLEPEH